MREFPSPTAAANPAPSDGAGWLAWMAPETDALVPASDAFGRTFAASPAPTVRELLGAGAPANKQADQQTDTQADAQVERTWTLLRRDGQWRGQMSLHGRVWDLHAVWPTGSERALLSAWPAQSTASTDTATMAAQLGHELRTPLAGVLSLTELVLGSELGERQRKLLDMALQSGRQMLDLINHTLDLAKLDAGALQLAPRPFALHDCLRNALQPLLAQAHAKGVALNARVQPGVPHRLLADELRLRQVLTNLAGNALKFTAQGQVRVELRRGAPCEQGVRLVVSVTDTGVGMAPEQQRRLFRPYGQADASVAQRHGGTGLGLVISQRLVALMGGSAIEVESSPGVGSSFRFEMPVHALAVPTDQAA